MFRRAEPVITWLGSPGSRRSEVVITASFAFPYVDSTDHSARD
jgi:hypothetical protein